MKTPKQDCTEKDVILMLHGEKVQRNLRESKFDNKRH